MADVVVTLPKSFGLEKWMAEGDAPGEPWTGQYYAFTVAGAPKIELGERVYVVHDGRLIGYAPLVQALVRPSLRNPRRPATELIRGGGAVARTIDEHIPGFRGYRYRWWDREAERIYLQPCSKDNCEALADSLHHAYDSLCDGCGEPFCEDHLFEYDGYGDDGSGQYVTELSAPMCTSCVESSREPLEVD